jgi:hypothetical protein
MFYLELCISVKNKAYFPRVDLNAPNGSPPHDIEIAFVQV